ncbi:DUF11 domain-containing protein [Desulfosudis oleivorans]|uniref:Conserved repeat domain n=1 Tax=Desulfosudis oleivorans (strain DSM 6200 / JCM 39069 / Hxd3) TaxID=96561 RepID=A9A0N8_DESOH|nr:DUF11 domain-containing protein [Desulfosudis oleivorans]ABW69055.1 conserved repeat domain [Desulfosudis oleivorans Hxd3]
MKLKFFTPLALVLGACLLLCGGPALAEDKGSIELASIAEVEAQEFNSEGQRVTVRKPAGLVVPGKEVIYTTTYTNIGTAPAENVIITNPVPEHMVYKENSAAGQNTTIVFSIDNGKTYQTPDALFVKTADGTTRPATASDYTHIRWTVTKPVSSGEKGVVSYRAILK